MKNKSNCVLFNKTAKITIFTKIGDLVRSKIFVCNLTKKNSQQKMLLSVTLYKLPNLYQLVNLELLL